MSKRRRCFKTESGREAVLRAYRDILDAASVDARTREVATELGRTHVLEAGPPDADALLLLHGTGSNAASWLGDVPVWQREFRVIAPDMPGEPGLSEDRRMRLAGDDASRWLFGLLDGLAVDRASVVGMSLGGWAALGLATRSPDRVAALSLIAPSGLAPARRSFLWKALPLLLLGGWGLARIERMVYRDAEVPPEFHRFGRLVAEHCRPVVEPVPVYTDDQLRRLTMPVQYFGGVHDALLRTRASAERLAGLLPHAEVNVLADAGHVILGQADAIGGFVRAAHAPRRVRLEGS